MKPTLLQLSKPRTWPLLIVAFLAGLIFSGAPFPTLIHPTVAAFLLYFTLPAHLLMHGTDHILNQQRQPQHSARALWKLKWQMIAVNAPFAILAIYIDLAALVSLIVFVLAAIFTKQKRYARWLDYVLAAIFGFFLIGGSLT